MKSFLTDLYERPIKLSTLLGNAGMSLSEIEYLREQHELNDFVLRFCPKLWEWLGTAVGYEARGVVVGFYALCGGRRRQASSIARSYGMTGDEVEELRKAALSRMRDPVKRAQLERLVVSTAKNVLEAYLKKRRVSSCGTEEELPR